MKKLCSWCSKSYGDEEESGDHRSGSICGECYLYLISRMDVRSLEDFLNDFHFPVLVVDRDVRVLDGNSLALNLTGLDGLENHMAGEVFECAYASEKEGCGHTVHCKGCAIRKVVTFTHSSGEGVMGFPCHVKHRRGDGYFYNWFELSTRKVGESVVMAVKALGEGPEPSDS